MMKAIIIWSIGGFFLGSLVIPMMLSIYAMWISFDSGVALSKILFPFAECDEINVGTMLALNGLLYATIACVFISIMNLLGRK